MNEKTLLTRSSSNTQETVYKSTELKSKQLKQSVTSTKPNKLGEKRPIEIKSESTVKKEPYSLEEVKKSSQFDSKKPIGSKLVQNKPLITDPLSLKIKDEPVVQIEEVKKESPQTQIRTYFNRNEEPVKSDDIQEKIAETAKKSLKLFFKSNTINKEEYKYIMKKVVGKVKPHIKHISMISEDKISNLAIAYVKKVKANGMSDSKSSD